MSATREVIQPRNPALNVSKNLKLPHSPGIKCGDFIFLSGMVSVDPTTGQRKLGTTDSETRQILENMAHMLESAGSSLARVVKINVLLTRASDVAPMNALYASAFGPAPYPARTTCVVQALPDPKMLIEIEAVASLAGR